MTKPISEGDIFRWSYKDEQPRDRSPYQRYHCKSQICIMQNGVLVDTYWGTSGSNATWSPEEAVELLSLVYLGNSADFERRHESDDERYDDADCLDLNHSNSSRNNFYVRKGAKRSAAMMLETARTKREKAVSDIVFAASNISRLDQAIRLIESGADLDEVWV